MNKVVVPNVWNSVRVFVARTFPRTKIQAAKAHAITSRIRALNCRPFPIEILNVLDTFDDGGSQVIDPKKYDNKKLLQELFERKYQVPFSAQAFRELSLKLLNKADAVVVATPHDAGFEVAYNIYAGTRAPVFMAVSDQDEQKVSNTKYLLEEQDCAVPFEYCYFNEPEEMEEPLERFLSNVAMRKGIPPFHED